ncbi:MAG: phosphoenolpyruvate--protein phosphotransferase [Thermoguttaceae bacterium]|jgi:phosphotransferase system enzyme I (PtsI)
MKIYQGFGVSSGIAIGQVMALDNGRARVQRRFVRKNDIVREVRRLEEAIQETAAQIESDRDSVSKELGVEYGHIFGAHLQIISDKKLREELVNHVKVDHYTPEYAVTSVFDRHADRLKSISGDVGISERANDIYDIQKRLLRRLMGIRRENIVSMGHPVIIAANNLTPSETCTMDRGSILAFVTETGGQGSHTAIVASALQIPAVLGVGSFLDEIDDGDIAIVDGKKGVVILDPDEATIQSYEDQIRRNKTILQQYSTETDKPAVTTDGVEVSVYGNIEFPYEARICLEKGAKGIGLYRTEFLYLAASPSDLPSEDTHFEAYKQVVEAMEGKVTTIRTFDLGADKLPDLMMSRQIERNPFMGVRSIRLSLRNTQMFRKQLRAILRASAYGKVRVMFPLISTILEYRQARMIFSDVCEELYEAGIPFDESIPVGMMVEVPATVIMLDTFVREVAFFSIGTNDLVQYTLAVDRSNEGVGRLYNNEDPAVLRLLREAIRVPNMYAKPVSLCGQMGSNPIYTMLLLGLGLRDFSVSPQTIPEIKALCRKVSITECCRVAEAAMRMETARDVRNFLKAEMQKYAGEAFDLET